MRRLASLVLAISLVLGIAPSTASAVRFDWTPIAASHRFVWKTPAPQGNAITALDFVTPSLGWAVGSNGTVIKTADGGFTWTQQGPIAPQGPEDVVHTMRDVCFVDATTGWAIGGNLAWRTTDGGTTWNQVTPELYDPTTTLPIMWRSVDFSDAANGWLVSGNRLYRSTNGGLSWTAQTNPAAESATRVHATSSTTAFAEGFFAGYLHTSDGGAHWTQRFFNGTAHVDDWADSIAAVSESKAYVATGGDVLLTANGGSTWTTMTVGNDPVYDQIDYVCTVDGDGTGSTVWAFSENGNVYSTVDGGASPWDVSPGAATYISSPDAPSQAALYVAGDGVECSTNGGASFYPRSSAGPAEGLESIAFATELTGTATGGYDLMFTVDGGARWIHQDLSAQGLHTSDVFFLESNPQLGWIVGSPDPGGSSVLKTTDAGDTWASQPETDMAAFRVCFADENNGWATNNSWGGLWHSADGGANWSKLDRDGFLRDIDFVGAEQGWIALDPDDGTNKVLHTGNGGSTWTTQTVPASGGSLIELDFADTEHGWCADTFGNVYRTANGGTTWTLLASSPGSLVDIEDMKFTSATQGWIVGEQWSASVASSYRHDFAAYTRDGGLTWDYQDNPTAADKGSTGSATGVKSVESTGGASCWIAGNSAILRGTAAAPSPPAKTPVAYLSKPIPTRATSPYSAVTGTLKKYTTYRWVGGLKPYHATGGQAVYISLSKYNPTTKQFAYVRKYQATNFKRLSMTEYRVNFPLPPGRFRLTPVAPEDTQHLRTVGAANYITVK